MMTNAKAEWKLSDLKTKQDVINFFNLYFRSSDFAYFGVEVDECWERITELFTREEFVKLLLLNVFCPYVGKEYQLIYDGMDVSVQQRLGQSLLEEYDKTLSKLRNKAYDRHS